MLIKWCLATTFLMSFILGTSFVGHAFTFSMLGFWPACIALVLAWIYLIITSLYYLEATLANPLGANVFTISRRYIGNIGGWLCSGVFYCTQLAFLVTYVYFMPLFFSEMLPLYGYSISAEWIRLALIVIFGIILLWGVQSAMYLNLFLLISQAVLFYQASRIDLSVAHVLMQKIHKWSFILITVPGLINALYFHSLIPTIATFLNHDRKKIRSALICALTTVMLFFVFWQLVLSISMSHFDWENYSKLKLEILSFDALHKIPLIGKWLPYLLVLGIFSTGLGLSRVLYDFLSDAFKFKENRSKNKLGLTLAVFLPAYFFTWMPIKPLFHTALFLTDFGVLFSAGLLPILWIWKSRYFYQEKVPPLVPGGKNFLLLITLLSCFLFYLFGLQIIYQTS